MTKPLKDLLLALFDRICVNMYYEYSPITIAGKKFFCNEMKN